jgi:nucleoside-diphosphate-sugar epimerase
MTQISILGCGWLGLPLAARLIEKGFAVNGSTTTENKMSVLKNLGINPFLIDLNPGEVQGQLKVDLTSFLAESDILIIDIPPKLRPNNAKGSQVLEMTFVRKISHLIPFIVNSSITKVLFVSSTAVYGDHNGIITEQTIAQPETESGKQLLLAEVLLKEDQHFQTTVLRFGGLIGEDRHPVKFLAGKESLENAASPVNLIHRNDCIAIIEKIIDQAKWNEIFNAVAPFHPTREEYYTQKAQELQLVSPQFSPDKSTNRKIISSDKIKNILHHPFKLELY